MYASTFIILKTLEISDKHLQTNCMIVRFIFRFKLLSFPSLFRKFFLKKILNENF